MAGLGRSAERGLAACTEPSPARRRSRPIPGATERITIVPSYSSKSDGGLNSIATQPKLDGYTLAMASVCLNSLTPLAYVILDVVGRATAAGSATTGERASANFGLD